MNLVTRSLKREQRSLPCVRKSDTSTLCKMLLSLLQLERFAVWEYQMQDAPGDGSGVGWQSLVSAAITIVAGIWRGCLCTASFAWYHALCYLILSQTFEKSPQWPKIAFPDRSCHFLCFKTHVTENWRLSLLSQAEMRFISITVQTLRSLDEGQAPQSNGMTGHTKVPEPQPRATSTCFEGWQWWCKKRS